MKEATFPIRDLLKSFWDIDVNRLNVVRDSDNKLAEIVGIDGNVYILKGENNICEKVNRICEFANELKSILPVSTYIKTINSTYAVEHEEIIYTLEFKLPGKTVEHVTDQHINEIGKALGKMHRFSLEHAYKLNQATSWSMFGGNKTDNIGDYDENEISFLDFEKAFSEEIQMAEIKTLYMQHRSKLEKMWPYLPKAATQGDFCHYNMLFNETDHIVGIFDFNLAGDEVLINECIAVGIYLSWHVKYIGEKKSSMRFEQFIKNYTEERTFNELEMQSIPSLFAIIRAFRFDRVEDGINDSLNKTTFLNDTLNILKGNMNSFNEGNC